MHHMTRNRMYYRYEYKRTYGWHFAVLLMLAMLALVSCEREYQSQDMASVSHGNG